MDGTKSVLLFDKDQNIAAIRRAGNTFKDAIFPAGPGIATDGSQPKLWNYSSTWLSCKVNTTRFKLICILKIIVISKFEILKNDLKLNKKAFLLKIQKPHMKVEFVLDEKGQPPKSVSDVDHFYSCFSIDDVFQGYIGDCFLIAAIIGVIKNRELLAHLIPMDNADEKNKLIGAYHFRLWNMGDWHDVVVDDILAVTYPTLSFCRNQTFPNEFWAPLLEKAIAKYCEIRLV